MVVKDSAGNTISGALLTLESKDHVGVSFHYTNEDGILVIDSVPGGIAFLKVTAMGYNSSEQELVPGKAEYQFVLLPDLKTLENIVIRDKQRPRVISKGDTTFYRVKDFVSPADKTLEDVLRKLPGVEVDAGGTILFKGKAVGTLYIEGDNLLGNSYRPATKNLRPGMVDTIQFIENNQPVKILQGREPGKSTDLNITMSDKARMHWLKFAEVGAGLPNNYLGKLNAMAFKPEFKTLNVVAANNEGEDLLENIRQGRAPGSFLWDEKNFYSGLLSPATSPKPPLPQNRWLRNKSVMATANVLFKSNQDQSFAVNAGIADQHEREEFFERQIWMLPGDTLAIVENSNNKVIERPAYMSISSRLNAKEKFIENKLGIQFDKFESDTRTSTQTGSIRQLNTKSQFSITNVFSGMFLFRKTMVPRFASVIEFRTVPESGTIFPGILPDILNDSIQYLQTDQKVNYFSFHTANAIGLSFGNGVLHQNWQTGINYTKERVSSSLLGRDAMSVIDFGEQYYDKGIFEKLTPFLYSELYWNRQRWTLQVIMNLSAPMSNYHNELNDRVLKRKAFRLEPSVRFEQKIGKENKIVFYSGMNQQDGYIQEVYNGVLVNDYRTLTAMQTPIQTTRTKRANMTFEFQKSLQLLFARLQMSYNEKKQDWITDLTIEENRTVFRSFFQPNTKRQFQYNGSFSKYIYSLSLNFSLQYDGSYSHSVFFQNGHLFPTQFFQNNFQFKLQKKIDRIIEGFFVLNYQKSAARKLILPETKNDKSSLFNQILRVNITPGKWVISSALRHFSFAEERSDFLFADAEVRFSPAKLPVEFSLTAINLTNTARYETHFIDPSFEGYSLVRLRPLSVFAKCFFSF